MLQTSNNVEDEDPMFILVHFLYASICYHYADLDKRLSKKNQFRVSSLFLDTSEEVTNMLLQNCHGIVLMIHLFIQTYHHM